MSEMLSTAGRAGRWLLLGPFLTFAVSAGHAANSNEGQQARAPLSAFAQSGPASAQLEIPPVIDRPLGVEEGPRVFVSRFDLSGAVSRPDADIRISEIQTILDDHVSSQSPDGFAIGQLQAVADDVTNYYRERGLILAQAFVPAQDVVDNVVRIEVLEGELENIVVEGNRIFRTSLVQAPFRRLQGQPVTQGTIERALLDVQDYPGLTVFGTFTQGQNLGGTDLVVQVPEEDRFYVTPSVDNYGSIFTGEYRAALDFRANNLFGAGDQIGGYILQSFEPDNGIFGGIDLSIPVGITTFGFGASTNQFDVTGVGTVTTPVSGTADQAYAFLNFAFANGRFFGSNGRFTLTSKRADTEATGLGQPVLLNEDKLTVASFDVDFFHASRSGRGVTIAELGVDIGLPDTIGSMDENGDNFSSRQNAFGEFAGGDFAKVRASMQHLRRLSQNNSLLFRVDGQWTSDLLVALEQYSIGGPRNVRAYPVAEALADIAATASLEWIINAPGFASRQAGNRTWGEIFQVSLFADYGWGELIEPLANENARPELYGAGIGFQFNIPNRFFARLDVASPLSDPEPTDGRDPQYFFRMSYTF